MSVVSAAKKQRDRSVLVASPFVRARALHLRITRDTIMQTLSFSSSVSSRSAFVAVSRRSVRAKATATMARVQVHCRVDQSASARPR